MTRKELIELLNRELISSNKIMEISNYDEDGNEMEINMDYEEGWNDSLKYILDKIYKTENIKRKSPT